jgi:hypothetical protein
MEEGGRVADWNEEVTGHGLAGRRRRIGIWVGLLRLYLSRALSAGAPSSSSAWWIRRRSGGEEEDGEAWGTAFINSRRGLGVRVD